MADVKILSEETEASEQPGNISELSGDVNCDGTVDLFDLMRLKRYLLGTIKLSEQGRKNAMLTGTENREEPDAGDLLMLKNILLAV